MKILGKVGAGDTAPTLLIGAHDRHNFGDLLFAHVAASCLPGRTLIAAGLAERDLTPYGGFRVEAVATLARRFAAAPVELIHVGGEILTTTAWQAAVMLAAPDEATRLIARFDAHPPAARAYAAQMFGFAAEAPYVVGRALFPRARRIVFNAVGGADLADAAPALQHEVFAKLAEADGLVVRDRTTQATLATAGIVAELAPDPVAMIAERCGARIDEEMTNGEVASLRSRFPAGFVAAQFAAECGDDVTLTALARAFDAITTETGWGIVFFRAGSAPWHDDLEVYRRGAARLTRARWSIFASLDVWQIAALIAASRGFIGTSLHGHVVATAFALPAVNFLPPGALPGGGKLTAYLSTWALPGVPASGALDSLATVFLQSCATPATARRAHAQALAQRALDAARRLYGG